MKARAVEAILLYVLLITVGGMYGLAILAAALIGMAATTLRRRCRRFLSRRS